MYRLALTKPCKSALQRTLQRQCQLSYSSGGGLPPNVREAGFGKVIFFLSPFLAVGGAVTYAKYDKDFRKMLEQNVPGAETIIRYGLQEENPFEDVSHQMNTIKHKFDSVAKSIDDATTTVTGFFGSSEKEATKPEVAKPKSAPTTQTVSSPVSAKPAPQPAAPAAKAVETVQKSAAPAAKPLVEPLPKDVLELEHLAEVSAAMAVKEFNKAISVLKIFNDEVRKVVDDAVENADTSLWTTLKNKTTARDSTVDTAEKLAREAIQKIEKCQIALSKVATTANHEKIMIVRNKVKSLTEHINSVKDELYKQKDLSSMSEKYWRSVEKARHYFIDEIESIFPGLNLSEKKLNLSKEDLDLFITHAYSHVLAYQKELERLQTESEVRLKRAVDAMRGGGDSDALKAQLEYHLEAEKRNLTIENQKKIFKIRAESERQLRIQLKQQAEAHIDHLNDAIAVKESELKRNYSRELEDKLSAEKANYKLQLAAMVGKIRGMDAALQARAETERSAHQSQALWAACQALWSSVRSGEPGENWRNMLRPLKSELKAISQVAEGDELVAVVIQNLPEEAEERGVFSENALRERFLNVERVARKVALVGEQGASIPMYFLSYLQSLFILRPDVPISEDELKNKEFDFSKLDTYDILNRARYFIDRGDLVHALKYMNLLEGCPRKIASDWLKETRLFLETQQAANTLMAHAAASGLLYL